MKTKMPSWLRKAIFYEIYPQSYYDSNADGIGDIPGIIQKLDYIESLGVNAIWLTPCFKSPFQDAGYDVSDYYRVAPRYGTNADLELLIAEAGRRNIRIILDLVPGHTSVNHPWFQQSQKTQKNRYSDWYIWNDSVWNANDWDLPAVRGYAERDASYITNFFYFQPALNFGFANPDPYQTWQQSVHAPGPRAVRQEIKNIMRFWLEKGVSGFRVDMAASLVKRDPGHQETARFWSEVRAWLDQAYPDAVLISEWGTPPEAIPAGFHIDMLLNYSNPGVISLFRKRGTGNHRDPYGWSFFDESGHGNIRQFLDEYMHYYTETRDMGYMAFITGNHDDHPRIADGRSYALMKLVYLFLLSMPGTPIIYYGDEIGMQYMPGLPSKEGGYARTGVRTPMQWSDAINSGFSTADPARLYLPVPQVLKGINVQSQQGSPDSLLNAVRDLITLRKKYPALDADASFEPLFAEEGKLPFIYSRFTHDQRLLIAINPANQWSHCEIPKQPGDGQYLPVHGDADAITDKGDRWAVQLKPVSGVICESKRQFG